LIVLGTTRFRVKGSQVKTRVDSRWTFAVTLDFDNFRSAFVGNFRTDMTNEQLHYLELIDKSFEQMDKDCFSSDGVKNSKEWQRIRELAAEA
jgi:hypothetical protein